MPRAKSEAVQAGELLAKFGKLTERWQAKFTELQAIADELELISQEMDCIRETIQEKANPK